MQEILHTAPHVRFVADHGVSQMRLQANKLGVLTASRRPPHELIQVINELEMDGPHPIWDELSVKHDPLKTLFPERTEQK